MEKEKGFINDVLKTFSNGLYATGCTLSFFGLEYLCQNILGTSTKDLIGPSSKMKVFSPEFGIIAAQLACLTGTCIYGVSFTYNAIRTSVKIFSGKYFKR